VKKRRWKSSTKNNAPQNHEVESWI